MQHRERLNQLLLFPTGSFAARSVAVETNVAQAAGAAAGTAVTVTPAAAAPRYLLANHAVRAATFRAWQRLTCAWAGLLTDAADTGSAERRLGLLLLPLRELWKKEENGDVRVQVRVHRRLRLRRHLPLHRRLRLRRHLPLHRRLRLHLRLTMRGRTRTARTPRSRRCTSAPRAAGRRCCVASAASQSRSTAT